MTMDILREYINLVLEFRKPLTKGVKKFSYEDFERAQNKEEYLETTLPTAADHGNHKGSSRAVYILNTKRVLKYAWNEKGLGQNRAEATIYERFKDTNIFPKIYTHGKDYSYLVSELVRPLKNTREFAEKTGCDWNTYQTILAAANEKLFTSMETYHEWARKHIKKAMLELRREVEKGKITDEDKERAYTKLIRSLKAAAAVKSGKTSHSLVQFLLTSLEAELLADDLGNPSHFGITPEHDLVILDYGYTTDVWEQHYQDGPHVDPLDQQKFDDDEQWGNMSPEEQKQRPDWKPTNYDPKLEDTYGPDEDGQIRFQPGRVRQMNFQHGPTTRDQNLKTKIKAQTKRDPKRPDSSEENA